MRTDGDLDQEEELISIGQVWIYLKTEPIRFVFNRLESKKGVESDSKIYGLAPK